MSTSDIDYLVSSKVYFKKETFHSKFNIKAVLPQQIFSIGLIQCHIVDVITMDT